MSYMHIENLYANQNIRLFKRCYAMEKIHGSSAHVSWHPKIGEAEETINFFAGGCKHESFLKIFNHEDLLAKFRMWFPDSEVTVYGEVYGGSLQGMSSTYGKEMRFVAFEATVNKNWLTVPNAEDVALKLGLDFVPYHEIPTTLDAIDAVRDMPSEQAIKLGVGDDKMREGVVLRPLIEVTLNNDRRVVSKHKGEKFSERKSNPNIDPNKKMVRLEGQKVAEEFVVLERLMHVVDRIKADKGVETLTPQMTKVVIDYMIEDVEREAAKEIVVSEDARKAIGSLAAKLYIQWLKGALK